MDTVEMNKLRSRVVCLVAAIFLITAQSVIAQITVGGVTISIPKRTKASKTATPPTKVEPSGETSAARSEETGTTSAATSSVSKTQSDAWLEIMLEDINKKKAEVESYNPSE